ncbi:methylated-DNA--protein-cysteine methyltransferase [Mobula birostris]|uniref:methylated-DNA--protein-cysteine methyltransferase n=1 Tax=Mobula birostris TaxID=1983395 RepID=UPI003B27DF58
MVNMAARLHQKIFQDCVKCQQESICCGPVASVANWGGSKSPLRQELICFNISLLEHFITVGKNNIKACKQMTAILESPIGAIQVSGCGEGIHSIQLQDNFVPKDRYYGTKLVSIMTRVASFSCELCESQEEMTAPVKHCMTWLQAYFCEPWTSGKLPLPVFHHPIFQQATFTCNVLRTLLNDVKFGEMISYKQLATLAGNSKAVRAVGGAMRSNPEFVRGYIDEKAKKAEEESIVEENTVSLLHIMRKTLWINSP